MWPLESSCFHPEISVSQTGREQSASFERLGAAQAEDSKFGFC
jgi:hypothetical protein